MGPEGVDGGAVRAVQGFRWRFVADAVIAAWLPLWFVIYDVLVFDNLRSHGFLSVDIAVYREAAQRIVSGGDPWAAQAGSLAFAGPPPSLLLYLPTAFMPLPAAVVLGTGLLLGAAVWAVRRLELPLWWILFPPVFESVVVGNPDVLVLALLLVRGRWAGLAAVGGPSPSGWRSRRCHSRSGRPSSPTSRR
jgi:Glycosyltransferase family 87